MFLISHRRVELFGLSVHAMRTALKELPQENGILFSGKPFPYS